MKLKTITLEGGQYVINYDNLHRTFGGKIYASDFETEYAPRNNNRSQIADRIFQDWRFDDMCSKGVTKNRDKERL